MCAVCAERDQGKRLNIEKGDHIGYMIPAVLTPERDTFWGYTSVPFEDIQKWYDMQTFLDDRREIEFLRAARRKAAAEANYWVCEELKKRGIKTG